jgi:hypothetical protein
MLIFLSNSKTYYYITGAPENGVLFRNFIDVLAPELFDHLQETGLIYAFQFC